MKQINISEEINKFLYEWFNQFKGKLIYFNWENNEGVTAFFVEDVQIRKGIAKAKISLVDGEGNKLYRAKWSIINNLRDEWNVINKDELKKMLIIGSLK